MMFLFHNNLYRYNIKRRVIVIISKITRLIYKTAKNLFSQYLYSSKMKMARDPHAVSVDQDLSVSPYRFPDID